jgi:hypothetical protein
MDFIKKILKNIEFRIRVYLYTLSLNRYLKAIEDFKRATREYEKAQQSFLNYLKANNFQIEIVNQAEKNLEEKNKIRYIG